MTVQNDFITFAAANSANVVGQATYAGSAVQINGFTAGVAPSSVFNKPLRQMATMAAVLAQLIVTKTGRACVDDGTTATLTANLALAIQILAGTPLYLNASATLNPGGSFAADTAAGSITLTLPPAPPIGTILEFSDFAGTWDANPLIVSPNGATIQGVAENLVANIRGEDFRINYNGSDWRLF